MAKKAHPGFKAGQRSIARRENISEVRAAAILASSGRRASPAAVHRNPNLTKIKGR